MNEEKLATKADLKEFYTRILPYLGNTAAGFTPIGTIIAVFGETAPANYLICDGTAYNKADYPELAAHLLALTDPTPYEVSGDNTKFKVPDLRGEFLRGTGTNSHDFSGSGAAVGVHQVPTQLPGFWHESANRVYMGTSNSFDSASNNFMYHDIDAYVKPGDIGGTIRKAQNISTADRDDQRSDWVFGTTIRPTNTSVLFCIATKNIYMGGGGSSMNYSTDEQEIGTFNDKPLYQKTYTGTISNVGSSESTISIGNLPSGIDSIISLSGTLEWNTGSTSGVTSVPYFRATNNYITLATQVNAIKMYVCGTWYSNQDYFVTILYTKSTDVV